MINLFFNIIFFIIVFIVASIAIMWLFIILKKTIDIIKDEIDEMIEEHKEHKTELLSQEFFENDVDKTIKAHGFDVCEKIDCVSPEQAKYIIQAKICITVCDNMKEKFDKMQDEFYDKGYGSYYGGTEVDEGTLYTYITLTTGERYKYRIWSNK